MKTKKKIKDILHSIKRAGDLSISKEKNLYKAKHFIAVIKIMKKQTAFNY